MPTASTRQSATAQDTASARESGDAAPALMWEWRSFSYQPQLWRAALLHGVPTGTGSMTAETYLLAGRSPDSVKLRNDRVEVKELACTDPAGLEAWKPVFSERFPLTHGGMDRLCDAWRRPRADVPVPLVTPVSLVSFLYGHVPEVRVIPLRTWRRGYRVRGCMAERATVLVGGAVFESLALEHPDEATLAGVLRSLNLNPARNTNYVTWLKGLPGPFS